MEKKIMCKNKKIGCNNTRLVNYYCKTDDLILFYHEMTVCDYSNRNVMRKLTSIDVKSN